MNLELKVIVNYTALFIAILLSSILNDSVQCQLKQPASLSIDSIKAHIQFLSNDALQGRAAGSEGSETAANYIAGRLKNYGLKPAGANSGFYQNIPMHGSTILKTSQLKLYNKDDKFSLELGNDYLVYKYGVQTFIPNPVQLVFIGYGIVAPEYDYNSYESVNVEGKIVVFLPGEPRSLDEFYFAGDSPTLHSSVEVKQRVAFARGARGSIFISGFENTKENIWGKNVANFSFEDVSLAYSVTSNLNLMLNANAANHLFNGSRYSFEDIHKMISEHKLHSFALETKISFKGNFNEREFTSANVIGVIEGNDPKLKDNYLIISSHYDHLGIGHTVNGDSIYNGVIDNASGVAAALEIARYFTSIQKELKRSILFIFTTGEEKGLLGSYYYIDNPSIPLYKSIANINIDGLAFLDTFNSIIGIGSEYSTLNEMLDEFSKKQRIRKTKIPDEFLSDESFYYSDQFAFAKAGIPSVLISEGFDYKSISYKTALNKMINWFQNIYHSPIDDLNQELNYNAMLQHSELIAGFCYFVANNPQVPEWYPSTPFKNIRMQTQAEKR